MIEYRSSEPEHAGLKQQVASIIANSCRDDYGTLILDRFGQVRSAGTSSERIFGASQDSLTGRPIAAFIEGLFLDWGSPSFTTRYLAFLSRENGWRKFAAMDASGEGFVIELKLSRMVTEGEELFLLNLRRAESQTHFQ